MRRPDSRGHLTALPVTAARFGETPRALRLRRRKRGLLLAAGILVVTVVGLVLTWRFAPRLTAVFALFMQLSFPIGLYYQGRDIRRFAAKARAAEYRVCPECGYLLTGLPDAGNCPECGTAYTLEALRRLWERLEKPFFTWPRNAARRGRDQTD